MSVTNTLRITCAVAATVFAMSSAASADHTTLPVTSGLQVWYEPSDPGGFTTDGNGKLVLVDQSSNVNNASTIAGTPSIGTLNGLPAVQYDNTNEALQAAAGPGIGPQDAWTYFVVLQPQTFTNGALNDGNGSYFVDRNPQTAGGNPLASLKAVGGNYGVQIRYDDGSGLGGPTSSVPIATNGAVQIVTWKRNYDGLLGGSDQFELYVNDFLAGTSPDSGANMTLDAPVLGRHGSIAGGGYTGLQGDFLIYNRALTADEQTAVYEHLAAKYVPEPAGLALLGVGALGLLSRRRRA